MSIGVLPDLHQNVGFGEEDSDLGVGPVLSWESLEVHDDALQRMNEEERVSWDRRRQAREGGRKKERSREERTWKSFVLRSSLHRTRKAEHT